MIAHYPIEYYFGNFTAWPFSQSTNLRFIIERVICVYGSIVQIFSLSSADKPVCAILFMTNWRKRSSRHFPSSKPLTTDSKKIIFVKVRLLWPWFDICQAGIYNYIEVLYFIHKLHFNGLDFYLNYLNRIIYKINNNSSNISFPTKNKFMFGFRITF